MHAKDGLGPVKATTEPRPREVDAPDSPPSAARDTSWYIAWDTPTEHVRQLYRERSQGPHKLEWEAFLKEESEERLRRHRTLIRRSEAGGILIQESLDRDAPQNPLEHVRASSKLESPIQTPLNVPREIQECLEEIARHGVYIKVMRADALARWKSRAKELTEQELKRREHIDKSINLVTRGINVSVLREIAEEIGFEDMQCIEALAKDGFPAVGKLPATGRFQQCDDEPSMTLDALRAGAQASNRFFLGRRSHTPFWKECCEAAEKDVKESKMVEVPLPELGSRLIAERFGVLQSDRVRPIDNYLSNRVNEATAAGDQLTVETTELLVFLAL